MWWCLPVVPATWEAEAGELLELGRRTLQKAEITPLYSGLSNRTRLCLKQTNKQTNKKPKSIMYTICVMGALKSQTSPVYNSSI